MKEAIEKFSKSLDGVKINLAKLESKKFCDEHYVMENRMEVFIAKVSEWMLSTTEYRKSLCTKIDTINDKISELPCKERKGFYTSVSNQMRIMWGFISAIVLAVIVEWVKTR